MKKPPDSPIKEMARLMRVLIGLLVVWILVLIYAEFMGYPQIVSDILVALISGTVAGALLSLVFWVFDKLASEGRYQLAAHKGMVAIINQSALFLCDLSAWGRGQNKSKSQQKLQKYLTTKEQDAVISLCLKHIKTLENIRVTSKNIKGLVRDIRKHLDFLERTLHLYDSCFLHYEYYGCLLAQHSELHKISLVFENTTIPLEIKGKKIQNKKVAIARIPVIEKALGTYLDSLELFLQQTQKELEKRR